MTSYMSKENYERMMLIIKKENPNWDGDISSLPIIIEGSFEVTEELKHKIEIIVNNVMNNIKNKQKFEDK